MLTVAKPTSFRQTIFSNMFHYLVNSIFGIFPDETLFEWSGLYRKMIIGSGRIF